MVIWLEDLLDDEGAGDDDAEVPDEDRVVDVTDDVHDPVLAESAIADDDGWSLTDIEAARFTRH